MYIKEGAGYIVRLICDNRIGRTYFDDNNEIGEECFKVYFLRKQKRNESNLAFRVYLREFEIHTLEELSVIDIIE